MDADSEAPVRGPYSWPEPTFSLHTGGYSTSSLHTSSPFHLGDEDYSSLTGDARWMHNNGLDWDSGLSPTAYTFSDSSLSFNDETRLHFNYEASYISLQQTTPHLNPIAALTPTIQFPMLLNPPLSLPSSSHAPACHIHSSATIDISSLLNRVLNRPNPKFQLGSVDLTSSFVVVDARQDDHPVVYCSSSFCRLTGYREEDILSRNCRFLQAPRNYPVRKGEERKWTGHDAVTHLKINLDAGLECQASVVNYRQDGSVFVNLVTIVPVPEPDGETIYHVGFQVDLTEQPVAIFKRVTSSSNFTPNLTSEKHPIASTSTRKLPPATCPIFVSDDLVLPLPPSSDSEGSHPLSKFILSESPDCMLVVSLKGVFLYVAPAVAHILGYDPEDLVNKGLEDIAHPADVVPIVRDLKCASATSEAGPKLVDLLFRTRSREGEWVWVECRGRLHVEAGKGRKAIVMSARVADMSCLHAPLASAVCGTVSAQGAVLVVTREIGGWTPEELVGRCIFHLFDDVCSFVPGPRPATLCAKDGSKMMTTLQVWQQDGGANLPFVYQISDVHSAPSASFDVFEELRPERGTTWQYELQQLRLSNQRLEQQIRELEVRKSLRVLDTNWLVKPEVSPVSVPAWIVQSRRFWGEA